MEKYDRNKLVSLQNKARELHAAYIQIADDRRHYMKESRVLKKIIMDGDRKGAYRLKASGRLVKAGKDTHQENKSGAHAIAFIGLHEIPLNQVMDAYKGHPSEDFINVGTLGEYVRFSQEYERLDEHFKSLTARSQDATRVVEECMDYLLHNGFSETEIPRR